MARQDAYRDSDFRGLFKFPVRRVKALDSKAPQLIDQNFQDIYRALEKLESSMGDIYGRVRFAGNKVVEARSNHDASDNQITFQKSIYSIEIYHSQTEPKEFTVNGISMLVPPNGWRSMIGGDPSNVVTIPSDIMCIVFRLE